MDDINLSVEINKGVTELIAKVSSLKVSDNSNDQRFPYIFQNQSVEGQEDLVTFKLETIDKESDKYMGCETIISLGFSGLIAYWKPQTMINLLEFINENSPPPPPKPKKKKRKSMEGSQVNLGEEMKESEMESKLDDDTLDSSKIQRQPEHMKHKGCLDKPEYTLKVNIKLAYL